MSNPARMSKTIAFKLTPESEKWVEFLQKELSESQSGAIRRAIHFYGEEIMKKKPRYGA